MEEKIEAEYKFKNRKLEYIWYVMFALSDSMFSSPQVSMGEKGVYALSCENAMSAMHTIITIDFCCESGHFSDAFTLARKYRDDLMQYLYILDVMSRIHGLSDEEMLQYDMEDTQSVIKMLEDESRILVSCERKSREQMAVEAWFFKDLHQDNYRGDRTKFFGASKYKSYLVKSNDNCSFIMERYLKKIWETVDRTLNNYVHGNGINYIYANYAVGIRTRKMINEVVDVMQSITSIFLSMLAMIDATKMHSSDYIDALELGQDPIEGSQYWVSSCIVEYMEESFIKIDENLLPYIEANNGYGMKFRFCDYEI